MANTRYSYDQAGKSALRSAITSHAGWAALKAEHNISSATLTTDLMETLAGLLGIDCSQYGKEKGNTMRSINSGYYSAQPKPKTVEPSQIEMIAARFENARDYVPEAERERFFEIYNTITAKQNHWATEKQKATLLGIVIRAEAVRSGTLPVVVTEPAQPVQQAQQWQPQPAPAPTYPQPHPAPVAGSVQAALDILQGALQAQQQQPAFDDEHIIALIKQHSNTPATMNINLATPAGLQTVQGVLAHHRMPLLLAAMQANVNVMLVGPAGTGKTHAVKLAAELLNLDFKFTGAIDSPYKLTGFTDAQGRVVRTPFRDAVEHGAVFLQDEADACLAGALLPINAVASNGVCDFPDAIIKAHESFRLIMACNTFGRGADRQYVGRNQQDAAVLDRYAVLTWDVDPALEAGMLGLPRPANAPQPAKVQPITDPAQMQREAALWLARVQTIRSRVEKHKIRHVVSPRASVMGAKLLQAGWAWSEVEEACIFKGIDADTRAKLETA
jgi:hypothetical protein